MSKLNVETKFKFGDKVKFKSELQECSGQGTVYAITVYEDMEIDYMIQFKEGKSDVLQPGIQENEMILLKK